MEKQNQKAYMPAIHNKRVEKTLSIVISASPQIIFPLACPVEELKWIPGWEYDLIYSKSGVNELNCIFNEYMSGPHFFEKPLTTTWVTAMHDPADGRIIFQLNVAGKAVIQLRFRCIEKEKGVSNCTWNMVFTAMDNEANAMPEDVIAEKMGMIMEFLLQALKFYSETGKMIE